jgi:hypothetical protein
LLLLSCPQRLTSSSPGKPMGVDASRQLFAMTAWFFAPSLGFAAHPAYASAIGHRFAATRVTVTS